MRSPVSRSLCCYQSQNYKIWKQFTTWAFYLVSSRMLLSITKLRNLKAIHNSRDTSCIWTVVVINHKTTKFESNSQPHRSRCNSRVVVINHKTTKFESNSQLLSPLSAKISCCYQSQNYKIWKQFTTVLLVGLQNWKLLSITKLQNLKAIHNAVASFVTRPIVVINHKTTKFESNSQLLVKHLPLLICCNQSQNYKIWKQFTTRCISCCKAIMLLSITKLQNLKAIHNYLCYLSKEVAVVINHKTTKFESNSQRDCL